MRIWSEGQQSFREVLRDWVNSPTHCELLIGSEDGGAGYGKNCLSIGVLHMAKELPRGSKRTRERYISKHINFTFFYFFLALAYLHEAYSE